MSKKVTKVTAGNVVVRIPIDSQELGEHLRCLLKGASFCPVYGSLPLHEVTLDEGWTVDEAFVKKSGWKYIVDPIGTYVVKYAYSNRGPRPSGSVYTTFIDPLASNI